MVRENKYNRYALWLCSIPGIGSTTIRALMERASGAEEIYYMEESEICRLLITSAMEKKERETAEHKSGRTQKKEQTEAGIKTSAAKRAALIARAKGDDPAQKEAELERGGIGFVCMEDAGFPDRLREIPDSPYGLYYLGGLPREDRPSVAVIGARNCSGYGREQARVYAERLAMRGITVISGMARGVDGIAGRAALDAGGDSYAVLGCGVDVVYPTENAQL